MKSGLAPEPFILIFYLYCVHLTFSVNSQVSKTNILRNLLLPQPKSLITDIFTYLIYQTIINTA